MLPVTPRVWPRMVTNGFALLPPAEILRPGVIFTRSSTLLTPFFSSVAPEKALIEIGTLETSSARRRAVTTTSPRLVPVDWAAGAGALAVWAWATPAVADRHALTRSSNLRAGAGKAE